VEGHTMGTSYHITYFDARGRNFKAEIDSILEVINHSINTYDSLSEVSKFNQGKRGIVLTGPHLRAPLAVAREVFTLSKGAFDLTVMPLVNSWGFGYRDAEKLSQGQIDSIKTFIGLEKILVQGDSLIKTDPRVQLDFGGIGQGYGADVLWDFFKSKGIQDILIELGGEGMAMGKNLTTGQPWTIGILDPQSTYDEQFYKLVITLKDRAFTTSGNYFNYREVDGKKYSHTIDPFTGYPAERAILSASIFSTDATTADAWGTTCMVLGHEKAIQLLEQFPGIDAILMYTEEDGGIQTYITPGIKNSVKMVSE